MPQSQYAGYRKYGFKYNEEKRNFQLFYEGYGTIIPELTVYVGEEEIPLTAYAKCESFWTSPHFCGEVLLLVTLQEGPKVLPFVKLKITSKKDGWHLEAFADEDMKGEKLKIRASGKMFFGEIRNTFAVALDRSITDRKVLRAASGAAALRCDHALLDRDHDNVLNLQSEYTVLQAEMDGRYSFEMHGPNLQISVLERYYEQRFLVNYGPVNKKNTFPKPPAGWMTWYAVKFDACEEAVLENARIQQEKLKAYGADTIWVDWEWYHGSFNNPEPPENISFFAPDPVRYPRGLKPVAEDIRKMGFTPALWVGPTCEPTVTPYVREAGDSVLADYLSWCGRYYMDITDEKISEDLIPRAFAKVKEWGYDALKWDCIPITLMITDMYHDRLKHPEWSTDEAMRKLVRKARETVGKNFYMLSCSGELDRVSLLAADIFDAARIGGDVFTWSEFRNDIAGRLVHLYPYHNVMMYCDPDNVVLRPEYNTLDQARARISLVSLLGLPCTFGDDLRTLPEERFDVLRRGLPTMDVHPMDIWEDTLDQDVLRVSLRIERPFETWTVLDVVNLSEEPQIAGVDFQNDLQLDNGEYLVYDYWHRQFVGIVTDALELDLEPCESRVLAIRQMTGHPQILSSTRHLSQGGVELEQVRWNEESLLLSGIAHVVGEDHEKIMIYVPENYECPDLPVQNHVAILETFSEKKMDLNWTVHFQKKG